MHIMYSHHNRGGGGGGGGAYFFWIPILSLLRDYLVRDNRIEKIRWCNCIF